MHKDRDAFGVAEARARLGGISNGVIYRLINSGELESFTIGTRRLISHRAINDYIRRQESKPTAMRPTPKKKG